MRVGSIVAQLMATKAFPARRERAVNEPRGQLLAGARRAGDETRLLVGAILSTAWRSCESADDAPTISGLVAGLEPQLLDLALQPGGLPARGRRHG